MKLEKIHAILGASEATSAAARSDWSAWRGRATPRKSEGTYQLLLWRPREAEAVGRTL